MNCKSLNLKGLTFLLALLAFSVSSCKNDTANEIEAKSDTSNTETSSLDANSKLKEESMAHKVQREMESGRDMPVYNLTQVDVPPLFDVLCIKASNPGKCSEGKLLSFIKENAKFPSQAASNASSLEQVLIVIEQDGSVSGTKYIASGNKKFCKGCQQAAVDVVGKMAPWTPAIKDGKPVSVKMTIPIKFRG